jgi:hypothetical protein
MLYRLWEGRKYPAATEAGTYVLGDPALGRKRHVAKNAVVVRTESEAVDLIKRGYYLRVEPLGDGRPALVRLNLFQDGTRLT